MDSGFPQRSVTSPALQEVLRGGGGSDSEAQSFHCPPARARVTPGGGCLPVLQTAKYLCHNSASLLETECRVLTYIRT